MKNALTAVTLIFVCLSGICAERSADIGKGIFEKQEAELTMEIKETIDTIVSRIKDGAVSEKDGQLLSKMLELVARGDILLRKTAAERRQVIIGLIGEPDYETIRAYYTEICRTSDSVPDKLVAIEILGYRLFSTASKDVLLPLLLSFDRREQFFATVSLACIGEQGAFSLIRYMIMSGLMKDYQSAYALRALGLANDPEVGRFAVLLSMLPDSGPLVVSECLPLLRDQPEYHKIVFNLIKSNRFSPSARKPEKTAEELFEDGVIRKLLSVIRENPELLCIDKDVCDKITMLAESNSIDTLVSLTALRIIKASGKERKYFEGLLKSDGLYKAKEDSIRRLIALIDRESSGTTTEEGYIDEGSVLELEPDED